jgi:hypothetical protein
MLARKKMTRDSEITIDDETMEKAIGFLKDRLSPEDLTELKQLLSRSDEEGASDGPEPPDFKGKPKPGGTMVAADARGKSYADMWPDAARITVL